MRTFDPRDAWANGFRGLRGPEAFSPLSAFLDGRPGGYWQASRAEAFTDLAETVGATWSDPVQVALSRLRTRPRMVQETLAQRMYLKREPRGVGRTNLGEQTGNFSQAPWSTVRASVVPAASEGVTGALTMDKLVCGTDAGRKSLNQSRNFVSGRQYTIAVDVKGAGISWINLRFSAQFAAGNATYRTDTGVTSNSGSVDATRFDNLGNGIWRAYFTATATGTGAANAQVLMTGEGGVNDVPVDGVSGVFLDRFQMYEGIASNPPPYQRVTTSYDVTQAGIPDLVMWSSDASGRWMATGSNIDMSGQDGMTMIWAGRVVGPTVRLMRTIGLDMLVNSGSSGIIVSTNDGTSKSTGSIIPGTFGVATAVVDNGSLVFRWNGVELSRRDDIGTPVFADNILVLNSNQLPSTAGRGAADTHAGFVCGGVPPQLERIEAHLMQQMGIAA